MTPLLHFVVWGNRASESKGFPAQGTAVVHLERIDDVLEMWRAQPVVRADRHLQRNDGIMQGMTFNTEKRLSPEFQAFREPTRNPASIAAFLTVKDVSTPHR